jgi:branched-chain amino acid transport system permease protein
MKVAAPEEEKRRLRKVKALGWFLLEDIGRLKLGAAVLIAMGLLPLITDNPNYHHILILVAMYAMLAQAWNILGGYAGQVSLGHAVFFGIGAYTSAMMVLRLGISPWIGMLAGGIIAVAISLIIGLPSFRLAGHYFAIATIAIGEIVRAVFTNNQALGGAVGFWIPLLPPSLVNFQFGVSKTPYYYIVLALMAITFLISFAIDSSKLGFYFRAIKNDPQAAMSLGVDITRYKLIAMGISAFLTSAAGTFYAQYVLIVDPESVLSLSISVLIAVVAILGGVGTFWGPLLGAAVLMPLAELTRSYLGGRGTGLDLAIYGALIVVISVFQPGGLVELLKRLRRLIRG